jgi:hypothetical protein
MIKMAKQFKENKQEDDLAGELDSLVYRSKKVTLDEYKNAEKEVANEHNEEESESDIDPDGKNRFFYF